MAKADSTSKVTIRDICREAGVSIATVSRVLNNSPLVTDKTRDHVLETIERLGFKPNAAGRNLSRQRTDTLGVVFHQMTSGFYASVISGVDVQARALNYHTLITISDNFDPGQSGHVEMLDEARVDGMIVLDSTLDDETVKKLRSSTKPVVMIQKVLDDDRISTISADNHGGAYAAMKHLLDLGYRELLLVAGPDVAEDSRLRMDGCKQALKEYGVSFDNVDVITGHFSAHEAAQAFRAYRKDHALPRAIFAFNDDMALAIMKELRLSGISVPGEVAIVGFDGIEAADYMGLTTVTMPMMELGQEAVKMIAAHIEDSSAPAQHVTKECELLIRETCGASA